MSEEKKVTRRGFFKVCGMMGSAVALNPAALASNAQPLQRAGKALLTRPSGSPLKPADLVTGRSYVFHYPYSATPCFLLDLGRSVSTRTELETEKGETYQWQGGVGPARSIVAFSAICAHKMSYPTRRVSFINYRHRGMPGNGQGERDRPVIYCCSEGSIYDPADGARVLGGPAQQPLAAVALAYDESTGELAANGIYGGDMFRKFFDEFGFQLALENRSSAVSELVTETTTVWPIEEYCSNPTPC
jgi:Rieske Fe-S protein